MPILSKKQLISILVLVVVVLSAAYFAEARELELNYPSLPNPTGGDPLTLDINTSLPDLIVYLYTFFISIAGLIAFASFIFAGFLFMTSGANPGLRSQAQNRIRQAILGLALLLGIYILLTIINPELVLLQKPGFTDLQTNQVEIEEPAGIFDSVDYATLRYGGVVVFADANVMGATGKSEVILHDIVQIENESYLAEGKALISQGDDAGISGIKILGNCTIELLRHDGSKIGGDKIGPRNMINDDPGAFSNDEIRSLTFKDRSCLGHSVKMYEGIDYNENAPPSRDGTLLFLTSDLEWRDRDFVQSTKTKKLKNNASSIRFAFDENDPIPTNPLKISLCDKGGYAGNCLELSNSTSSISSTFNNNTASLRFDSQQYRQAGVVLYEEPNFKGGRQEVFIASDKNLDPSFVKEDHLSALRIIGKYRVTLYGSKDFVENQGWIRFDNSDPENPTYSRCTKGIASPCGLEVEEASLGTEKGLLEILTLDNSGFYCYEYANNNVDDGCKTSFNDKISSIKIEVLKKIYINQTLGPTTSAPAPGAGPGSALVPGSIVISCADESPDGLFCTL